MKKTLIIILLALSLGFCGKKEPLTPEKTLQNYFSQLSKTQFDITYWDLNTFAKIYYQAMGIWDNASEQDKATQVKLLADFIPIYADRLIHYQKALFESMKLDKIEKIGEQDGVVELRLTFVNKLQAGGETHVHFFMSKVGEEWKIGNYNKLKFAQGEEVDTIKMFKETLPEILKNQGYDSSKMNLEMVNDFMTKMLKKAKTEETKTQN